MKKILAMILALATWRSPPLPARAPAAEPAATEAPAAEAAATEAPTEAVVEEGFHPASEVTLNSLHLGRNGLQSGGVRREGRRVQ
jgi:hypothetical protein